MDEQPLISQLKMQSPEAFKHLVNTHKDNVFNTCLGFVKKIEDAEDLAQEVFVEVYRSINKFRMDAKLSTWIYRIAVSKSLEHIRHGKRKKRAVFVQSLFGGEQEIEVAGFDHPGVTLENKERATVLMQAVEKLCDNQRVAFTLHKIEGLSYQEVADVMKVSVSSVESLMHRAKKKLKLLLFDYYKNQ